MLLFRSSTYAYLGINWMLGKDWQAAAMLAQREGLPFFARNYWKLESWKGWKIFKPRNSDIYKWMPDSINRCTYVTDDHTVLLQWWIGHRKNCFRKTKSFNTVYTVYVVLENSFIIQYPNNNLLWSYRGPVSHFRFPIWNKSIHILMFAECSIQLSTNMESYQSFFTCPWKAGVQMFNIDCLNVFLNSQTHDFFEKMIKSKLIVCYNLNVLSFSNIRFTKHNFFISTEIPTHTISLPPAERRNEKRSWNWNLLW